MSRRQFGGRTLAGVALAASRLASVGAGATLGHRVANETVAMSEAAEGDSDRLTDKFTQSLCLVFGAMPRGKDGEEKVAFLDQEGGLIECPVSVQDATLPNGTIIAACKIEQGEKKLSQDWLDYQRRRLKGKYPTIDYYTIQRKSGDDIIPWLQNPGNVLRLKDTPPEQTYLDMVWEASQESVGNTGETKLQCAKRIFAEVSKQRNPALPPDLQELLAYGIPALESGFDEDAISSAQAAGPWQFIPATAKEYGLVGHTIEKQKIKVRTRRRGGRRGSTVTREVRRKVPFDKRTDFATATEAAVNYFSDMYQSLLNNSLVQQIQNRFSLTERDFLYPCLISAYNTGLGNLADVLAWFQKNHNVKTISDTLGPPPYGSDIFTFMAREYVKNNPDKGFGPYGRMYYLKVRALWSLLKDKEQGLPAIDFTDYTYSPPAAGELSEPPKNVVSWVRSRLPRVLGAATAGAIAGAVVAAPGEAKLSQSPTPMSRRAAAIGLTGSVLGVVATPVRNFATTLFQRAVPPIRAKKILPHEDFDWGSIGYAPSLGTAILEDAFWTNLQTREVDLSRFHRRQPEVNRFLQGKRVTPFNTVRVVQAAAAAKKLIRLESQDSPAYRCFSVGTSGTNIDPRSNNSESLYAYPHTQKLIEKISAQLNQKLWEQGMPAHWRVRIIVNSLLRLPKHNQDVAGSSSNSSHMYGVAFDLAQHRFDIIDTHSNTFYALASPNIARDEQWDPAGVNAKRQIVPKLFDILSAILVQMDRAGDILLIKEDAPAAHVHIVDKHFDR